MAKKYEIQLRERNELRIQATQMIVNKPRLADLIEQKKIKEYPAQATEVLNKKLINDLLSLLNVKDKMEQGARVFIDAMIQEDYANLTYGEITEAFKMAIKGDLGIEMYQALDAVIFGRVMKAYRNVKPDILADYYKQLNEITAKLEYEKKQMDRELTMQDIEPTLIKAWQNLKEYGNIDGKNNSMNFLYKILERNNLIKLTLAEKKMICSEIIEIQTKLNKSKPKRERVILTDDNGKVTPFIRVRCENKAIEMFLLKFENETEIKEIIELY